MKKIVSSILIFILSLIMCVGVSATETDTVDLSTIKCNTFLPGFINEYDASTGRLHMLGQLDENNIATGGVTTFFGPEMTDFCWEFDFIPGPTGMASAWGDTRFMFHCPTGTEDTYGNAYGVVINGFDIALDSDFGYLQLIRNEARDNAFAETDDIFIESSVVYRVKIVVEGTNVKVWYDEKFKGYSEEPQIETTIDETYPSGFFKIQSYGSDFSIANMTIKEKDVPAEDADTNSKDESSENDNNIQTNTEENTDNNSSNSENSTLFIILIAVGAAVVVGAVTIIVVLLLKSRKKEKNN